MCFVEGVEGGFDTDEPKYDIEEQNTVVVLPEWKVLQLDDPTLPPQVMLSNTFVMSLLYLEHDSYKN